MESTYGKDQAVKWTVYWRTFFIAVAELFGYVNGEEWMVPHHQLPRRLAMTVLHHRPKELHTEVAMKAGYQGLTG
ncbi:hypothetical protein Gotur_016701 [Gossypium turneri]